MKHLLLASAAVLAFGGTAIAQQSMSSDSATAPTEATADPTDSKSPTVTATDSTPADASATSQEPTDATTAQATPATDSAPAATAQATDTSTTEPAATADASTTSTTQTASVNVQGDWAKYDPDNSGSLTPLEFGKWVMAANGQDMSRQVDRTRTSRASNLPAVKVLNATASAFSKADTNKDRAISPEELSTFLAG